MAQDDGLSARDTNACTRHVSPRALLSKHDEQRSQHKKLLSLHTFLEHTPTELVTTQIMI